MRIVSSFFALALLTANADAALTPVTDFGSNPGALDMLEYVPAGLPTGRPLVVVMHGCTQTASAMEIAGWNALADKYQFAVVYPQQRSANQNLGCFTWYDIADIERGKGEAMSTVQMVDSAIAKHGVDPGRVYVTGVSAGGAMVTVMLAAYPDRFRAGSVMSGLPYKCATDIGGASTCLMTPRTPEQWGELARGAFPGFAGPFPRVQIWHGSMDYTVPTSAVPELVKQWTNVWGIDQTVDLDETVSTATHTQYKSGDKVAVEVYMVNGMGHAIATGADAMGACPATTGAFFSDQKICSTLRAAQFFGLLGSDGNPDGDGDGDGDGSDGDGSGDDDGMHGGGGCNVGGAGWLVIVALLGLRRRARQRRAMSLAADERIRARFVAELRRRPVARNHDRI
jgi:poly(hydroxyalkanoate) depolymerase family esterase